ncbi:MAG: PilT/PilU family type 4a pilus ATPase [Polyangiales bacterium]
MNLDDLFQLALSKRASDILLSPGAPATLRVEGVLESATNNRLTGAQVDAAASVLLDPESLAKVRERVEYSGAADFGGERFRVSAYLRDRSVALALRHVPKSVATPEVLGLPAVMSDLVGRAQGLLLFAGASGQGKSTSQASLIDFLNRTTNRHVVTIEDPIEYVHVSQKCMIDQREIGRDSLSYEAALTHAMRENPDVILVGEMRSREAISAAIMLAEMGHLVLSTVHANDAVQTLHRILHTFSSESRGQVRMQLSLSLIGVLCQRLVLSKEGKLKLAAELLINTPAIAGQIREDRLEQIYNSMELDASSGMITMNHSLQNLVDKGVVDARVAERFMNAFQTRRR